MGRWCASAAASRTVRPSTPSRTTAWVWIRATRTSWSACSSGCTAWMIFPVPAWDLRLRIASSRATADASGPSHPPVRAPASSSRCPHPRPARPLPDVWNVIEPADRWSGGEKPAHGGIEARQVDQECIVAFDRRQWRETRVDASRLHVACDLRLLVDREQEVRLHADDQCLRDA